LRGAAGTSIMNCSGCSAEPPSFPAAKVMFDLQDLLWKNDNVVYLSYSVLIKPHDLF
jgi:hypothetical protein